MQMINWDMQSFNYGAVALVAGAGGLRRVCFSPSLQQAEEAVMRYFPAAERGAGPLLADGFQQLTEYFAGQRRSFELPLDGSELSLFARQVHRALLEVPYGTLVSYGVLAKRAGAPGAARAVGRVMSANPLPLLVPCHRVVRADGALGHYSGAFGAETKAGLISLERDCA